MLASCAGNKAVKKGPPTATLAAAGDLMMDRSVETAVWEHGTGWALEKVREAVSSADIAFVNLESPIAEKSAMLEKPIGFRAPSGTARLLADSGFDIVSLANNHAVDCGRDGLLETFAFLEQAGLRWCGAGKDRKAAEKAAVLRVNGLRVAFVAFCEFPEGSKKRNEVPTIALAERGTVGRVVAEAGRRADVVVASFHWGEEYSGGPTPEARALAGEAAAAGASLILGHHPHVVQGLETIPRKKGRPTLVAWSLGNFVFDQKKPQTREGLLLNCRIGRNGVENASLSPVRIDGFRPRLADPGEKAETLKLVAGLSPAGLVGTDGRLNLP
jgi:poly-gamma-glutamate synthesis protein (capsule biosynthesis protein)